jgi:hypothetical protein
LIVDDGFGPKLNVLASNGVLWIFGTMKARPADLQFSVILCQKTRPMTIHSLQRALATLGRKEIESKSCLTCPSDISIDELRTYTSEFSAEEEVQIRRVNAQLWKRSCDSERHSCVGVSTADMQKFLQDSHIYMIKSRKNLVNLIAWSLAQISAWAASARLEDQ